MSDASKINDIQESIEDMSNKINSIDKEKSKVKGPKAPSAIRVGEIFGIGLFLFFFYASIIGAWEPIQSTIFITLSTLDSSMYAPWLFLISSFVYTILIYYNFFVYALFQVVFDGISVAKDNFLKNFKKYQLWIIMPLAIAMVIDTSFLSSTSEVVDDQGNWVWNSDNVEREETGFWTAQWEKILCSIDVDGCYLKSQNQEDDQQTRSTQYNMRIGESLSSYRESQLQNREIPVNLEIQSDGGRLYLDKLECYRGDPHENNLVDTTELGHEEVNNQNYYLVEGLSCDLSSVSIDEDQDIRLTPVIYYTLELDYSQQIPIIDYELYVEENGAVQNTNELRDAIDVPTPQNTATQALSISRNVNPEFPIIVNSGETMTGSNFMDLSFQKVSSSLGSLQSTTLTSIDYPQNVFRFDVQTPYEIEEYNKVASFPLEYELLINSLQQAGTPQVTYPVRMTFEVKMVKDDSRIQFTLIDDVE